MSTTTITTTMTTQHRELGHDNEMDIMETGFKRFPTRALAVDMVIIKLANEHARATAWPTTTRTPSVQDVTTTSTRV